MYNCMRATGWISALYFISLVVFGNIIMLNLFLAILLGNFDEASMLAKERKFIEKEKARGLDLSVLNNRGGASSIFELDRKSGEV